MKRVFYIYKFIFPNDKIYIGQTVDISRRFHNYRSLNCKNQILLFNCLEKYGWSSIKIEILYNNLCTQNEIDNLEEYYINSINKENSLNILTKVNTFNVLTGSENPYSKPILQFDLNNNFIKEWSCLSQIKNQLNINSLNISKAINEKTYYAYDYFWQHKSIYNGEKFNRIKKISKKVVQLNKRGVFIKIFDSTEEAAESVNGLVSSISAVLNQIKFSVYGFIWVYLENYNNEDFKIRPNKKRTSIVSMYNLNNELIQTFNSVNEASLFTGLNKITIIRSCKNKVKKPYKYIFKYGREK